MTHRKLPADFVGHAYKAISVFRGYVFKYEGIATRANVETLRADGCHIRDDMPADRIYMDGTPYDGALG